MAESNDNSGQNKRHKTINECLSDISCNNKSKLNDKQYLSNLIAVKDESIGYKVIQSNKSYFKSFKRVTLNTKSTDYVKCDNCLILMCEKIKFCVKP
jgi:hypothetical protein